MENSYITPIFKFGLRNCVENYSSVAILPTIGKLFESMVCRGLTYEFKQFISPRQHGFISGRSTSTNLSEFTNFAINTIELGNQQSVGCSLH